MSDHESAEAQHDRPRSTSAYILRLRKWKVSETYEMVEEMIEMWRYRKERVRPELLSLLSEAWKLRQLAFQGFSLKGLEGELAEVRLPAQSPGLLLQEQELIQDLGLEQEWKQEKEERERVWKEEQSERSQFNFHLVQPGGATVEECEQERSRWVEEQDRWVEELVLRRVQERLKQPRLQRIQQEARGRLLDLVDIRQAQLMEPWRRRKELHDRVKVLENEGMDLDHILPQMRLASALLLLLLSAPKGRLALEALNQPTVWPLDLPPQGNIVWEQVDQLVAHRRTQNWPALEVIRAKSRPTAIQGQEHLLDVIRGNHSKFKSQSPYLDALLVFAGLFSAILSAFLIDIRKGLQEDLLLEILHQLQSASQPFQPTSVSIWVNGLWFSSLAASLIGVLIVMLAKSLARWTIDEEQASKIFEEPTHLQRRYREIKRIYFHAIFAWELSFLSAAASALIFAAVVLFFAGLAVLLYTTQKTIGIGFLGIILSTGFFILCITLHNIGAYYIT